MACWHLFKQIVDVWYPNVSLGMLAASTLTSQGTLGRSFDIGEHRKGLFEVQALQEITGNHRTIMVFLSFRLHLLLDY